MSDQSNPEGATTADGTPTGQPETTTATPEVPVAAESPASPTATDQAPWAVDRAADAPTASPDAAPADTASTTPEGDVAQPSPDAPSTVEPTRELPATTAEDFDPADPRMQEQTATAEVPDTPLNAQAPSTVDLDPTHGGHLWAAGTTNLDTGWFAPGAVDEVWAATLADTHGTQDGIITVPAHLREINDAALADTKAVMGLFGEGDSFRVVLDVDEFDGEVHIILEVDRKPAGA